MNKQFPRFAPAYFRKTVAMLAAYLMLVMPLAPVFAQASKSRGAATPAVQRGAGKAAKGATTAGTQKPAKLPAPVLPAVIPAAPPAPAVAATKTDNRTAAQPALPGDAISYTVVLSNTGTASAAGVSFADPLDVHTTLVPGSVNSTPVAFDQTVSLNEDNTVNVTISGQDPDGSNLTFRDPSTHSAFGATTSTAHGSLGAFSAPDCTTTPGVCTSTASYTPAQDYNGSDSFTFEVNDGTSNSNEVGTVSITISAVNDPPVITRPATASTNEDTALTFSGGNAISVSDVDAGGGSETVTLSVSNGTLTLGGTTNLTVSGNGTNSITATGTLADLNNGLNGLTYLGSKDYNGSETLSIGANDNGNTGSGGAQTDSKSVAITVNPVNDAPVAVADNYTTNEDTALSPDAASGVLANDTDVDTPHSSLAAVLVSGPSHASSFTLNSDGSFSYTPAQDYNGADSFQYKANDGSLDSNTVTVSITINPVNDPPSFTKGADQSKIEDDPAVTVSNWATNIKVGPANESGQTVTFHVSNDNNSLFSVQPAVSSTGTLTYTLAANQNGSATVSVYAQDNGGTANGGNDTSPTQTFIITVQAVNDPPVVVSPTASTPFAVQANMKRTGLTGLLSNVNDNADNGVNGCVSTTFTVDAASVSATSPSGGTISNLDVNNGTFDFDPPAGYVGNISFTYQVKDTGCPGPGVDSAPVTVTLSVGGPVIWFVNSNAATNGDGRLSNPFKFLSGNAGSNNDADDVDAANQYIFLYSGGTYTGGLTLNSGEGLVGQSATNAASFDALFGITPPSGTIARPSVGSGTGAVPIINAGGNGKGVVLGSGNTLNSLKFSATSGTAVDGAANVGTLSLRDIEVANTATAGAGVVLTGGGTVTSAGTNILATGSGTALNVTNTTIGASNLTFRSISSNGATNGIVLNNTGSSGGLVVAANGGTCTSSASCTGGAILNATVAISLTSTKAPSFDRMFIQNTTSSGISGTQVTGFTLTNSKIDNTGTSQTADIANSAIYFAAQANGNEQNLTGAVTITGNTLTNMYWHGIGISNFQGTISSANISNNTITSPTTQATSKGTGISFIAFAANSSTVATITKATIDTNTISNFPSDAGLIVQCSNANEGGTPAVCGSSSTNAISITNNTISGQNSTTRMGTQGMLLNANGTASAYFNVTGNHVSNTVGNSISHNVFGDATVTSVFSGNVVVSNNQGSFGDGGIVGGISVTNGFSTNTPSLTATISSNNTSQTDGSGIKFIEGVDNANGTMNLAVKNNTAAAPTTTGTQGIRVTNNGGATSASICLDITANTSAPNASTPAQLGIGLRKAGTVANTNPFGVVGLSPSPASASTTQSYVQTNNPNGGGVLIISGDNFISCSFTEPSAADLSGDYPPPAAPVAGESGPAAAVTTEAAPQAVGNEKLDPPVEPLITRTKKPGQPDATLSVAPPVARLVNDNNNYGGVKVEAEARPSAAQSNDITAQALAPLPQADASAKAAAQLSSSEAPRESAAIPAGSAGRAALMLEASYASGRGAASVLGSPAWYSFAPSGVVTAALDQRRLDAVVSAALDRWSAAGLTPQQVATLRAVRFEIGDLSGSYLGEADGERVVIDRRAGGNGWYTGFGQQSDLDFANGVSPTRRYSDSRRAPAGRVDLLTAVEHEMGHRLGLEDTYSAGDRDSLMYGYLAAGERRLPSHALLAHFKPEAHSGPHFLQLGAAGLSRIGRAFGGGAYAATAAVSGETVTVNGAGSGFTLPVGKTVTITFQATVNTGGGFSSVSNQGTVTGSNFSNVLTDDPDNPGGAGSPNPTVTQVAQPPVISAHDAKAVEPASGTAPMPFVVTLDHAYPQTVTVHYQTADGTATGGACGNAGIDYQATSGSLTFAAGEVFKVVSVPVCADNADNTDADETLQLQLDTPSANASLGTSTATGTITETNTPGTFLITELRTSGPAGDGDDFVELYNNSGSDLTVDDGSGINDPAHGYGVFKMGADCSAAPVLVGVIQNGTTIPARGHFLLTGSKYSLGSYGASDGTLDATASSKDVEADRNVAVFSTTDVTKLSTSTLLDAVGFGNNKGGVCDLLKEGATLPAVAAQFASSPPAPEYSFFRSLAGTGLPADTNDNASDFRYADTSATPVLGLQQLGSPGPEGMASPTNWGSQIKATLLDPAASSSDVPNRERVGPVGTGTLTLRRTFTNNTGQTVKVLRFRVVDMTTAPQAVGNGTADLRLISSAPATVPITGGSKQVVQMTLDQPPDQSANGGGLNSSIQATVPAGPPSGLAPGHSIDVQFQMTVKQAGTFRFFVIVEAVLQ